jgi:hypothetical protein
MQHKANHIICLDSLSLSRYVTRKHRYYRTQEPRTNIAPFRSQDSPGLLPRSNTTLLLSSSSSISITPLLSSITSNSPDTTSLYQLKEMRDLIL